MIRISVDGMSCANCARHVKEALAGLEGVAQVEVSRARQKQVHPPRRETQGLMLPPLQPDNRPGQALPLRLPRQRHFDKGQRNQAEKEGRAD